MQVFSVADDGPVVVLDAYSGKAGVKDYFRPCGSQSCPSMDLASYEGRVTFHSMLITFGRNGSISYSVTDSHTGAGLLFYNSTGYMGSGGT